MDTAGSYWSRRPRSRVSASADSAVGVLLYHRDGGLGLRGWPGPRNSGAGEPEHGLVVPLLAVGEPDHRAVLAGGRVAGHVMGGGLQPDRIAALAQVQPL